MRRIILVLAAILAQTAFLSAQAKIIAHRGHWNVNETGKGNVETPQNSLASYRAADQIGAWGSEFDVNMTSDGQLVVCHGPKIVSLADVQKETFNTVRGERLSNGEAVPSLDELLLLIKKSKIRPVLEIKEDYRDKEGYVPCFDKVAQALKKHRIDVDNLTIISFSLEVCKAAAKKYPKTMVQYLGGEKSPDELSALGIKGLDYHYTVFDKHPEWVKRAHDLGMEVNVWTVDKKRDIKRMAALGVDQITTNYPVLYLEVHLIYQKMCVQVVTI